MDNLKRYEFILLSLTPAQREVFPGLVVGAVSHMVAEGDWQTALNAAINVAKVVRPEREDTVHDVTNRRPS